MSDIKIVGWPKRPAEQRRDELEIENAELRKSLSDRDSELDMTMAEQEQFINEIAELRKLVEQMREAIMTECEHVCEGRLRTAECDDDCKTGCHLYAVITAAERGGKV